ncbi:hypothetical protein NDU88_003641 [Pleurodeles waltl]|uniref:Uncharacterized protein n=1 Tax=Pleurodeles waltl TaxID=8319 RepID=A0AAV7W5W6_PLEWA|nr:hypothetical protein NDU88_003641 [Pleurodeles waltl]
MAAWPRWRLCQTLINELRTGPENILHKHAQEELYMKRKPFVKLRIDECQTIGVSGGERRGIAPHTAPITGASETKMADDQRNSRSCIEAPTGLSPAAPLPIDLQRKQKIPVKHTGACDPSS